MQYNKRYLDSLSLIRKTLIAIAFFVFGCQMLFSVDIANILSNLFALIAFVLSCVIVFSYRNINIGAALSATVVFLIISANSLAPMVGTLIEGHPITETLTVPVETFAHRLIFALCLLFAHYLSRSQSSMYIRLAISQISKKLNTKTTLPAKSLWVIGAIGLAAILFKFIHLPVLIAKFFEGFTYLMPAPFLMLLHPYYNKQLIKKQRMWLILYYAIQIVFSFLFNSRMAMVLPVGIVGAGWILTVITGQTIVTKESLRKGIIAGIVGLILLGQFADLSTAILIERDARYSRTGSEQFTATVDRFFDKKAIAEYHDKLIELEKGTSAETDWQENYVRNPFLARFIQIKFDDNCFYRLKAFNANDFDALREVTIDRILVQLPQPALDLFSINIDKKQISNFSIGDKIDELASGAEVGGFKTGSIPTHAFALFSWWYPFVLIVLYYLIFSIYHGFFTPFKLRRMAHDIPTLALLLTFTIYIDVSLDGVDALMGSLIRGVIQRLLIYAIALWVVKKLKYPIKMAKKTRPVIIPTLKLN